MNDNYNIDEMRKYIERVRLHNEEICLRTGKNPVVYTHSYGCQQNVADGERMKGLLSEMGYGFTSDRDAANLILYNTCAVRENAEDRIFGNVGALKHHKRRDPSMIIGLCGCMVQQPHIAQKISKSYPYVDIVFGTNAIHMLPRLIYEKLETGKRVFAPANENGEIVEGLPVRRDGSIKAWLPIMQGCDNYCTYCVVPYVRGRERSRRRKIILQEAKALVAQGYKEITLLGQNVNSYGKGLDEETSFSRLLEEINGIEGDFRIRFMTSHPKDCTRELIDTIGRCEKVCRHIHLPVQSGSDRILRLMNRSYTAEKYLELIGYARAAIPGVSFTSDIMVGFPGETYEDFTRTLELVKKVKYHSLFTFIYSPREGTRAAVMADPVTHEEKTKWFGELLRVQGEIGRQQYGAMVGNVIPVLVEGEGKGGEGTLQGRSESNVIVEFGGSKEAVGQIIQVRITDHLNWAVTGEMVSVKNHTYE